MRFTEVEHKFVLDEAFDLPAFRRVLETLGPRRQSALQVRDRYFLTGDGRARHYILRHRFDEELHQLTIKSLASDPEVRDEINLDLGHHAGDQAAQVDAFVARMGVTWSAALQKDLEVWYFADCEVVLLHGICRRPRRAVRGVRGHRPVVHCGRAGRHRALRAGHGLRPGRRGRACSLVDLLFPGVLA